MRPEAHARESVNVSSVGGLPPAGRRGEEHLPRYFCQYCQCETPHGNVLQAARIAQVTRATIYNWKKRSLIHGVLRPSGRSFICVNSLLRPQR
jgi:hypothetical protein